MALRNKLRSLKYKKKSTGKHEKEACSQPEQNNQIEYVSGFNIIFKMIVYLLSSELNQHYRGDNLT